jgi:hypothetical protein
MVHGPTSARDGALNVAFHLRVLNQSSEPSWNDGITLVLCCYILQFTECSHDTHAFTELASIHNFIKDSSTAFIRNYAYLNFNVSDRPNCVQTPAVHKRLL